MAFWSDSTTNVPAPKRNFRWLLFLGGVPAWICKKVTKPAYSVTEVVHEYLNHKFYYPGRLEWQTIDVTLVDPVSPDAVVTVNNIVKNSGYTPAESQFDTLTLNKADAVSALGKVRIQQLGTTRAQQGAGIAQGAENLGGSSPLPVEEWILYNAWVKDVKYGELDYTSDDLTEITLTLRYDFAKLNEDNAQTPPILAQGAGVGVQGIGADISSEKQSQDAVPTIGGDAA